MITNAMLDLEVIELDAKRSKQKSRVELVPFDRISLSKERRYLVKGLVPHPGLTVVWGPPKSGKSFWGDAEDFRDLKAALAWGATLPLTAEQRSALGRHFGELE